MASAKGLTSGKPAYNRLRRASGVGRRASGGGRRRERRGWHWMDDYMGLSWALAGKFSRGGERLQGGEKKIRNWELGIRSWELRIASSE